MKHQQVIERFVYALLVILCLAALWLVAGAPASYLQARVVYQGF